MSEIIEVEVGNVYAQLNEDLSGALGDRYDEALREEVEDWIHERNKEIERSQEQALSEAMESDDVDVEDSTDEV